MMPETFKGTIFLLALVTAASMMPVEKLPAASWQTALGLGFVSAVFDNIPLTALALKQGGYDWGYLAYAVGFGGSMIWFGSSAGVALDQHVSGSEVGRTWLRQGWHVAVAYVVGFFVMLAVLGWHPDAPLETVPSRSPALPPSSPLSLSPPPLPSSPPPHPPSLPPHSTRIFSPVPNTTREYEARHPEAATSFPTQAPGLSGPAKATPRVP